MYKLDASVKQAEPYLITISPEYLRGRSVFDPHGTDRELSEDIGKHGVLLPLLITPRGLLLKGYRRLMAARHNRLGTVPVIALLDGADNVVYGLTMGRGPSVFSMCKSRRSALLRANEQAMIRMELDTGYDRRALLAGVDLLQRIDALEADEKHEQQLSGRRLRSTFKNKGLNAALRLAGLPPVNYETDAGQWEQTA